MSRLPLFAFVAIVFALLCREDGVVPHVTFTIPDCVDIDRVDVRPDVTKTRGVKP